MWLHEPFGLNLLQSRMKKIIKLKKKKAFSRVHTKTGYSDIKYVHFYFLEALDSVLFSGLLLTERTETPEMQKLRFPSALSSKITLEQRSQRGTSSASNATQRPQRLNLTYSFTCIDRQSVYIIFFSLSDSFQAFERPFSSGETRRIIVW